MNKPTLFLKCTTPAFLLILVCTGVHAQNRAEDPAPANVDAVEGKFSQEVMDMLQTLRNPFLSQLPKPVAQPVPAPRNVPQHTTPTVTQPAQTGTPENTEPEVVAKPNFRISGLIWDTDRPQAILDGTIVKSGDRFKDWRVINISKKGVLLRHDRIETSEYLIER